MSNSINKGKQRKWGVVLQYLQMGLSVVISLLYTPVMLRMLGQTEYGIYSVANSTIAYLSLLSLGIATSYIKFYSDYKKSEDNKAIERLNGLYMLVFLIIGIVSLVLGFVLSENVEWFFNANYSQDDIELASTLMKILAINISISFPASVFVSYITSQERFVFQKIVNIGTTVITPIFNICMLYLGYGSIGMVISTTICSIVICLINAMYCFKRIGMRLSFRNPSFTLLKSIVSFSVFIAINQLVDLINFQTDKLILSKFVNASAVAIYAIGSTINTLYVSISATISSVYAPEINRVVSNECDDMDDRLNEIFVKVGRIQWFIAVLILSGFVFFGKYFIVLWAGIEYEKSYYVALLLMVPMTFMLVQSIGIEVQRAKKLHHIRSIIYLFVAVMNVLISIWLAIEMQEIGAAFGTSITTIICLLCINVFYHKKMGLNVLVFWKSIISSTRAFIIPFIAGVLLRVFYSYNSIIEYVIFGVMYVALYLASLYLFGLNRFEKNYINGIVNKLLKRST